MRGSYATAVTPVTETTEAAIKRSASDERVAARTRERNNAARRKARAIDAATKKS